MFPPSPRQPRPMSLDALSLEYARYLQRRQPRADATIDQLPILAAPPTTAELPVFYNNQTWKTPISGLPTGSTITNPVTVFNVKTYGALGNGISDDSSAILNAYAAAVSASSGEYAAGGGVVYFPPGTYYYNSGTAITINADVSTWCAGGAVIVGGPASNNCFIMGDGETTDNYNYTINVLPSVVNFTNGAGITFPGGVAYTRVVIESIHGCATGILVSPSGYVNKSVFSATVDFSVIDGCGIAVHFVSTYSANDTMAGFLIRGNTIICNAVNQVAYQFDGIHSTTNASFVIPAVNSSVAVTLSAAYTGQNNDYVFIFDGTHNFIGQITAGAGTTSVTVKNVGPYLGSSAGFAGQTMATNTPVVAYYPYVNSNVFDVAIANGNNAGNIGVKVVGAAIYGQYIRSMGNWGAWEGGNVVCTNGGQLWNTIFDIGDYYGGYAQWVGLRNAIPGFHNGNKIRTPILNGFAILNATIAATTTNGATGQGSFNGGVVPIGVNNLPLSMAVSGLAAQASADFYAYSPYALGQLVGGARFTIENMSTQGSIIVTACEDETLQAGVDGLQYATQIHIRLTNVGTASYTGTVSGLLEVGTL